MPQAWRCSRKLQEVEEKFIEGGKKALAQGSDGNQYEEEVDELKKIIGDQSLVINELKKNIGREEKVMLFSNLKDILPVRRISAISGISSSTVYYKPSVGRMRRLPVETENMIVEMAGERPTYGYRRIHLHHGIRAKRNPGISSSRQVRISSGRPISRIFRQNQG